MGIQSTYALNRHGRTYLQDTARAARTASAARAALAAHAAHAAHAARAENEENEEREGEAARTGEEDGHAECNDNRPPTSRAGRPQRARRGARTKLIGPASL